MPARSHGVRDAANRQPTFTEQARRAQLIAVTIDLVAAHGYAGCSLQRIADAAGITKGAVIYHFATKNAVIRAAYDAVIGALTERVTAALEAASGPASAVDAYVDSMISHMAENPTHVRMIVEALSPANATGIEDHPGSAARWQPLADLITAAVEAREYRSDVDAKILAIMLTGVIDAVVAQARTDPEYDLAGSTGAVLDMLHRTALRTGGC
ncbi:TetR/AcrR family transcriptional regulator [Nocardiopsis gilva YIM 90087]|uniref:TetR/AcrR family transcriptional regulator n=1 Tax=Nocardiopsis gilva YIM 90087 TaxID=1235441 RepID=A0A223S380_9ACTN|nr:TetR/AcrR family transcriptional regulator [Nocardiopsis gilva]ASU82592.1 TetR/AcrR family transcriptional regulator [Nocardiopsis gilva YIM 90087]